VQRDDSALGWSQRPKKLKEVKFEVDVAILGGVGVGRQKRKLSRLDPLVAVAVNGDADRRGAKPGRSSRCVPKIDAGLEQPADCFLSALLGVVPPDTCENEKAAQRCKLSLIPTVERHGSFYPHNLSDD
jgi:hypothetical protein